MPVAAEVRVNPFLHVDENRIYIVSSAGEVICVSNSDGKILWSKRLDSPIVAAPAYSERSLFVGTQDGTLVSFDKKNGTEFWHKHFADGFEAPLSVIANLLLAPSTAGKLYALAQSDGQSAWTHNGTGKYSAAALVPL